MKYNIVGIMKYQKLSYKMEKLKKKSKKNEL